jgi:hypothetical protein
VDEIREIKRMWGLSVKREIPISPEIFSKFPTAAPVKILLKLSSAKPLDEIHFKPIRWRI